VLVNGLALGSAGTRRQPAFDTLPFRRRRPARRRFHDR
jgi:hypothetical protein